MAILLQHHTFECWKEQFESGCGSAWEAALHWCSGKKSNVTVTQHIAYCKDRVNYHEQVAEVQFEREDKPTSEINCSVQITGSFFCQADYE